MNERFHRRRFLGTAAAAGLAAGFSTRAARADEPGPNERIIVGVMGTGGRGTTLAAGFAKQPGVEIAYVCDVDSKRAGQAAAAVSRVGDGTATPQAVGDFRKILDDRNVDALVVATCNHWHAPAAILACAAGKHVYVEKPCSHNPREGELLVEAARKHRRHVQMGNQRRSWPKVQEAIARVRDGAIGRAYYARCMYLNSRPSIGRGKEVPVPEGLDYALWEGPAPHRPFHDNYLHYNWHWFWHWGNGELGNNGVHTVDVARWGLDLAIPHHVSSGGGRFHYDDDQETPDTHIVTYDFGGDKSITWEGQSCNPFRPGGSAGSEIVFYGTEGSLAISGDGYAIFDLKGKELKQVQDPGGVIDVTGRVISQPGRQPTPARATSSDIDADHLANFLAAIRDDTPLNSEIAEGHISTLYCHLGNIAHRTGRALRCDPATGKILEDPEAMSLWSREYAPGWEPKV